MIEWWCKRIVDVEGGIEFNFENFTYSRALYQLSYCGRELWMMRWYFFLKVDSDISEMMNLHRA